MDFNFNFGEHFYESGGSFWTNVLIAFIGAFFGLLSALWVNRIFENRGKEAENSKKNAQDIDRVKYLGIILKSTCKTAKKQIEHYADLAKMITENPLQTYMPIQVATYDAWRLKNLDSIELFDSFINIFPYLENNTKEYKTIFGHGDFIFEKLNDAKKQNERHKNFQHKDELFVRDCIEEIYTRIGLRTKNLEVIYKEKVNEIHEFNYLRNFENIYKSVSEGFADFKKIRDEYFIPLHNTILHNIDDLNFADSLFTIVKKALNRLQNIEFNAIEFAKNMEALEYETKEAVDYLNEQTQRIEKKIEL